MANIIAYIRKERDKGNVLIDSTGKFYTDEQVEKILKKSYIDGLKAGEIDFSTSFEEYFEEEKDSWYFETDSILSTIIEELDYTEMPVAEPQETIAQ